MFKAILIDRSDDGKYNAKIAELNYKDLPEGDVTVRVEYSTMNYKDALAITGKLPVVRRFPMVPGIDLAGIVEHSESPDYKPGDKVLLNGWGVGEIHWGGLSQKARVRSEWLIPLPERFTTMEAMSIGTAGYTAMLCVLALERQGITPLDGEILVTGASGGVGSVATAVLSKLGFQVVAMSGKEAETDYLMSLGAKDVVDRSSFSAPGKPLAKERWAAAIDTVAGNVLANVCASVKYRGCIACCGNASGMDFPASIAPFILRGITLVGIDSVMCPKPERIVAWQRLAADLKLEALERIRSMVSLGEVIPMAKKIIEGKHRGRIVVDVR